MSPASSNAPAEAMEFQRSIIGTIIFVILALLHAPSLEIFTHIATSIDDLLIISFIGESLQLFTIVLFVWMIFRPLHNLRRRYLAAILLGVSFVTNMSAVGLNLTVLSPLQIIGKFDVVIDVLIIVALCMDPYTSINRILPFYAVRGDAAAASDGAGVPGAAKSMV